MTPLPMTVFGGYLGAGKTTLINRVLAGGHGLRILVLVNDFGAINIDANLLISADEDTIELANGCVCCTMGADLFMAVGDVLDRNPRPDHLIIEASGIADPGRIANVAKAEPDLRYAGIVTVVDGDQFETLNGDQQIGPQIQGQIACADQIAVSKLPAWETLIEPLLAINPSASIASVEALELASILVDGSVAEDKNALPHPSYTKWSHTGGEFEKERLAASLWDRPSALFRVKGQVRGADGTGILVQVVGRKISLDDIAQPARSELIGIGLAASLTVADCDHWWAKQNVVRNDTKKAG